MTANGSLRSSAGDILAGAGIGLLVGLLIGLSVSEIVGSVVAGLVALLAGFFGLRSDGGDGAGLVGVKPARMARLRSPSCGVSSRR